MGLDLSHNCGHFSYGGFNDFRRFLSAQIGIDLETYKGYSDNGFNDLRKIKHKIRPILNHSDCDGYLTPKQAKMVAEGLNEILEKFDEYKTYDGFKENIIDFRDGCLDAYNKNQRVIFS